MRQRFWLALFVVAASGCVDTTQTPAGTQSTAAAPSEERWWDVEYNLGGNLTFENEIHRFRVVAEGPVKVATISHVGLPTSDQSFHCLFTAHHFGDYGDYVAPLWSSPPEAHRETEVRVLGRSQDVPAGNPFAPPSHPSLHTLSSGRMHELVAGQELLLDLGGDSSEAIRASGGEWLLAMAVQGPHRVERLPPASMACGNDHSMLEDSTIGASTPFASFEAGGRVQAATQHASTLIVMVYNDGLGGEDVSASFLGKRMHVDGDTFASAPEAGAMEVQFGRSASWQASSIEPGLYDADNRPYYQWLMADLHWPIIERLATTAAADAP